MTVATPEDAKLIIKELNLLVTSGKNILVTGNTGCGKTSLLRVIAGLWSGQGGKLNRKLAFGPRGVMYLPQKPLMTGGTILDQVKN